MTIKYKPLTPESVKYIVVHCAATPPDLDIGAKEIDRWHRERGFWMIGYHHVIRRNGTIEDGRAIDQPGAHVRYYNEKSVGVCLVGGCKRVGKELVPEANFTPEQVYALRIVLEELQQRWPNATVIGHRDLDPGKACPSFDAKTWAANGRPDVLPA